MTGQPCSSAADYRKPDHNRAVPASQPWSLGHHVFQVIAVAMAGSGPRSHAPMSVVWLARVCALCCCQLVRALPQARKTHPAKKWLPAFVRSLNGLQSVSYVIPVSRELDANPGRQGRKLSS